MNDIKNCCGTTCNKAVTAEYIERLEEALAVLMASRAGFDRDEAVVFSGKYEIEELHLISIDVMKKLIKPEYW